MSQGYGYGYEFAPQAPGVSGNVAALGPDYGQPPQPQPPHAQPQYAGAPSDAYGSAGGVSYPGLASPYPSGGGSAAAAAPASYPTAYVDYPAPASGHGSGGAGSGGATTFVDVGSMYQDQVYRPPPSKPAAPPPRPRPSASPRSGKSDSGAPRFRVTMRGEFGETYNLFCEIGMGGLSLIEESSGSTMETYPLDRISRWAIRDQDKFLFWVQLDANGSGSKADDDNTDGTGSQKKPSQKQIQLHGSPSDVRNILDTITAACMQLCEMIEREEHRKKLEGSIGSDGRDDGAHAASGGGQDRRGLVGWIAGKVSKPSGGADGEGGAGDDAAMATAIPEGVEYWSAPDYDGWLQSQGDHIKTWRRRWFVLKDGYLFRFLNDRVTQNQKPRGCLNIGLCKEVAKPDRDASAGPTIQCALPRGRKVLLAADSAAERDLWLEILTRAAADVKKQKEGKYRKAHEDWVKDLDAGFRAHKSNASTDQRGAVGGGGGGGGGGAMQSPNASGSYSPSAPREDAGVRYAHAHHVGAHGMGGGLSGGMGGGYGQPPPPPPPTRGAMDDWSVCYTPDGRAYYYNSATGVTQWEAP